MWYKINLSHKQNSDYKRSIDMALTEEDLDEKVIEFAKTFETDFNVSVIMCSSEKDICIQGSKKTLYLVDNSECSMVTLYSSSDMEIAV